MKERQTIPFEVLQRIGGTLLQQEWIYAKTMPKTPHWYALRKRWKGPATFDEVVEAMRQWGYEEYWWTRHFPGLLNINGWKYWTMGAPVRETTLINRKPIPPDVEAPYDAMAPDYDKVFSDPQSLEEDREVASIIGDTAGLDVLDIGCGTGMILDHLHPTATYTGIDPSRKMLERLVEKHPEQAEHVLHCRLEEYVGGYHQVALALFGTPNYITPEYVQAIPKLLRPGGRYVVMFLAPGYKPIAYERTGQSVEHYKGVHAELPGERFRLTNYEVVVGTV